MAQILDELNRQLQNKDKEIRKYAEDCIVIANKLSEIFGGKIYTHDWTTLVKFIDKDNYAPTEIGEIFLKGIRVK